MQLPVQKSLMQKPIFPSLFKNFTIFFAYFEFVVLEALKFLSVKKISHWKNKPQTFIVFPYQIPNTIKSFPHSFV